MFPAALAAAGLNTSVTGIEFLTASVAGYEVARRVLEAAGAYREHNANGGWHSTATCGAAAAAMAAGLILELTEDQLVAALGFALTMTGGTWAFNTDGAMSKRFHPWSRNPVDCRAGHHIRNQGWHCHRCWHHGWRFSSYNHGCCWYLRNHRGIRNALHYRQISWCRVSRLPWIESLF